MLYTKFKLIYDYIQINIYNKLIHLINKKIF